MNSFDVVAWRGEARREKSMIDSRSDYVILERISCIVKGVRKEFVVKYR